MNNKPSFEISPAPPVGEELHLPGPSLVPLINALGIAIALIGVAFSWMLIIPGCIIFLLSLIRWVRETKESIEELPAVHH